MIQLSFKKAQKYTAERCIKDRVWLTQDLRLYKIKEMSTPHLDNAINYTHRRLEKDEQTKTYRHQLKQILLLLKAEDARRTRDGIYIPR